MVADAREKSGNEKSIQTYAALGVGFVCIVIGLPLWWKTTEVYRVQLPYQEITNLDQSQVKYYIDFTLLVFSDDIGKPQLASFGEKMKNNFEQAKKKNDVLEAEYRGQIRAISDQESLLYKTSTDLHVFDSTLGEMETSPDYGQLQIVMLPADNLLNVQNITIGKKRNIFLPIQTGLDDSIPQLLHILKDIVVNEGNIHKIFYTAKGVILTKADKESMRSLKSHPGYDVTFTLLNPQPDILDIDWNIRKAIQEYMDPMLKAFAQFAEISVKSQYMHYTDIGVQPRKEANGDLYKLTEDQLPHIINPIEAYLSSHVSTNPNLNFILYITPRNHFPLHIYDKSGELSSSNSFLSPRWGGMMVYNVKTPEGSLPAKVELDMKSVMEVFLSQLRLLLGIHSQPSDSDVSILQPGREVLSEWEMDQWLRMRTLENIATATSTLKSLAQLLEEISNIVINDDIGREVERAVKSIHRAKTYLYQSRLKEAFVFARQALLSSEKAFFDPSLLELLYFPEDQKFAIYIPLFLPISIPVLMSVIQAFKRISGKDKQKTE